MQQNQHFFIKDYALIIILICLVFSQSALMASTESMRNVEETTCVQLKGKWNKTSSECCCELVPSPVKLFSIDQPNIDEKYFPLKKCYDFSNPNSEGKKRFLEQLLVDTNSSCNNPGTVGLASSTLGNLTDISNSPSTFQQFPLSSTYKELYRSKEDEKIELDSGDVAAIHWDIQYLSNEEQQKTKATISNGQISRFDNTPWDTKNSSIKTTYLTQARPIHKKISETKGVALYVIDKNGQLMIMDNSETGKFQHSSLVNGESVIAAGEIITSNGRLLYINNRSLVYDNPPPISIINALIILRKQGVNVDDVSMGIFYPRNMYCSSSTSLARDFFPSYGYYYNWNISY
ncbi:MAG: hypothetical protein HQK53_00525 [Oligoflexia bacterium]|nr:hypothetical protein [Oligoflexia bacterium]